MNIIINGATKGIGRETAAHLHSVQGNNIVITGRDERLLALAEKELPGIKAFVIDLSDNSENYPGLKEYIIHHLHHIDIVINVAGQLIKNDFLSFIEADAHSIMETNFFGPARFIRFITQFMSSGSHIVNISSMGGYQGSVKFRGLSYYSSSKAAIACLTECLANELSEHKIAVNCLALGSVNTAMLNEAFPGYEAPVSAGEMGKYIADFALNGNKFFNGKILPVALGNP
jgi:NAD(P)-dependent dehydrogenase (short-subunit alcohol dehydrogenase family)